MKRQLHRHDFGWQVALDGSARPAWRVYARCKCGAVAPWECTVADSAGLKRRLDGAFQAGVLSPLAYFTAPVEVP